jgi:sugar phosphate isomerase/epimerase
VTTRIRDTGLVVTGYCRGGMFPAPDREGRRAALDDNRRAVDEALAVGAQCLILVVGGLPKHRDGTTASRDMAGAREMVRDGIGERLVQFMRDCCWRSSRGTDVRRRPRVRNTMEHANDLCTNWDRPRHRCRPTTFGGPALERDRERVGQHPPRLHHHQRLAGATTELLTGLRMMYDGSLTSASSGPR